MLFATWEFFNPFFEERRALRYRTSLISCPRATSEKCSGPPEPHPARSEPVAFEHSGAHGIFSPPGTGFLLIFRFSFRSVAALPALLVPRIRLSPRKVGVNVLGDQDWPGRTCLCVTLPPSWFLTKLV